MAKMPEHIDLERFGKGARKKKGRGKGRKGKGRKGRGGAATDRY